MAPSGRAAARAAPRAGTDSARAAALAAVVEPVGGAACTAGQVADTLPQGSDSSTAVGVAISISTGGSDSVKAGNTGGGTIARRSIDCGGSFWKMGPRAKVEAGTAISAFGQRTVTLGVCSSARLGMLMVWT